MSDITENVDTVEITVNGRTVAAKKGEMVIAAADRAGEHIPRFCYHPRMSSVGMCRQCLVEIDTGRGPMLQPSCMVSVAPGMVVDTESETTKRAQEGILELLLANHPLDCPVCDKGGECPLQDQAFSDGPGESRYVEEKRHYEKPIDISALVKLDRERCILCDRCTRFADEVAGDALIHFVERGNATQVMTYPDEPFASHFSGNTVQICPVGALTATPYRFKARPWDLEQVDSTCTSCSVGCRISVHSSRDQLLRFQGVDDDDVNWGWLCDRGRFNFESVHAGSRVSDPLVRTDSGLTSTDWSSAMSISAQLIRDAIENHGPSSVAVIGGARGTNEDAWAWATLADALGVTRRDAQLDDGLPAGVLGLPRATIREAAEAATVILIAPDLKEELPILHLRLRHAAVEGRTRIIEFSSTGSGLTRHAWRSVTTPVGTTASTVSATLAEAEIAAQLASGPVVVVAGRANLAETANQTMGAVGAVLEAVPSATVLPALRRGNIVGALTAGLRPGSDGDDSRSILAAAADGAIEVLVLLGADPLADLPDADLARRGLAGARRVIALDGHLSGSAAEHADVVLPAAVMAEKSGTTTNLEGRVSSVAQKVTVHGTSRPDWMVAVELGIALGCDLGVASLEEITGRLAEGGAADGSLWTGIIPAAPLVVVPAVGADGYSMRLVLSRVLYDGAVSTRLSPSLAPLAGGPGVSIHPLDMERLGVGAADEVRLSTDRASISLPACPDDRLDRGTIWIPFGQQGGDPRELISGSAVTDVRIERMS